MSIIQFCSGLERIGFGLCASMAIGIIGMLAANGTAIAQEEGARPQLAKQRSPERIYESNCGYCHGYNVGPIIRGRSLPPQLVEFMVRNGKGAMPAFRQTEISPQELAALAQWISQAPADEEEHGQ